MSLGLFVSDIRHFVSPSSCGMLVYNEDTSMDASRHFSGIFVVSISLRKSIESLRYEGSFFMCGCNQRCTNWDMGSVMLLQLDTIGLIPIGVLWIFFKKYNLDVRVCLGGLQNSNHDCFKNPLVFNNSSLSVIVFF